MGLFLGHSAWKKVRPSKGSMWNSSSFQPIGPWMGYSFTDLGAEGCCHSLNALFFQLQIKFDENKQVSQMQALLAACHKPAGDQNRLPKPLYVFKHKTWYILIHASYTHILVFWHIRNIPPRILYSQICHYTPMFYIAAILLYNWLLVVLTYTLICIVWAAHH